VSKGGIQQNACNNCGNCVTGCNTGAKNTTLMNYIPDAHNHGCSIFTEIAVKYISRDTTTNLWTLHCVKYFDDKDPVEVTITCDVCIVAAGCLGSTELLLRSKKNGLNMSDMVGQKFTSNGDAMGFAYNGDAELNGVGYHMGDASKSYSCLTNNC
jgi:cholesterol oxidase